MTETPTTELRIEEDMSEFDDYRIEGVIKAANKKAVGEAFNHFLYQWQGTGSIVTNPDPTGLSLYKVEDVEGLRDQNFLLNESVAMLELTQSQNDEAYKSLAAQLEQKEKELKQLDYAYEGLEAQYEGRGLRIAKLQEKISTLETKLRLKENTLVGRIIQKLIWAGVGAITAASIYYISQQL